MKQVNEKGAPPDPLAGFPGPTSKEKGGEGVDIGDGRKRKGKGMGIKEKGA